MGLGHIKVIKGLTFLLKKNKSLIDLQLQLLEVTEPFNTKHGFTDRLCHIHNFFNSEQDAFTFLNLLYRAVYDSYLFKFYDIHAGTSSAHFQVNFRDGSSAYDATKTTTVFNTYHDEADNNDPVAYSANRDLAQSTAFQMIGSGTGTDNDQCIAGTLHLYNPSSTTFVKHFMSTFNCYTDNDFTREDFTAGYFNTTAAITALQFKFASGNIDAGDICLYGIS